ncbi:MAG TPA: type II toxin-antitoxin system prevent-host-death family antitoxin [Vicinamibacterales bacterium]|nr:type II toxin-antitoxin system prevent-host-death family antitoxin [Vicinamibacterales bacterium]
MDTASSTVGVRELRQNLSVYLEKVKQGAVYTVTEHGHVVAELRPAPLSDDPIQRLIKDGIATPATRSVRDLPKPKIKWKGARSLADTLDELREDRF